MPEILSTTFWQAVHERVDAVRRGLPPHVWRRVPGRSLAPGGTFRPGWYSTSSTATATSSRDCKPDNAFRRNGWNQALAATVERFDGFARSVDEHYHRGESTHARYHGDPMNKPNPNLGTISHARYYTAKMVPGDLGTKGGVRTDVHAGALRDDGSVIEGPCATDNVTAPAMGQKF